MHLFLLLLFVWAQFHGRLTAAAEPCAAGEPFTGLTYHVAPDGSDEWSGRIARPSRTQRDGPLASLAAARDRIRLLQSRDQPIRVVVQDGVYPLAAPLIFGPQDSGTADYPICYQADKGARPLFSAGRRITGWKPGADGVWWTDLPEVASGGWYFEQLWVNGRRARRARASDDTVTYIVGVQEQQVSSDLYRQTIQVNPPEIRLLGSLTAAELADVSFVALHKWQATRRFIQAADVSAGSFTVQSAAPMKAYNPLQAWTPYYIENFLAALDQPGEWFLSRSGRLHYKPRPGEDMATAEVVAPVLSKFLLLSANPAAGTHIRNLGFDGLSFAHSQWLTPPSGVEPVVSSSADAAIDVQGARNVLFKNCAITHTGTYAIAFWNGTRDAALRQCRLEDLGAGGVRIGDTAAPHQYVPYFTRRVTIDNNIIRHGGRLFHNAYAVWIGRSSDNRVTHNEIADFFQHGIALGWIWGYGYTPAVRNTVSFNHIHHLGWRLMSDIGGIHTLGESPGTTLSNNVIHDVYPAAYGGWGIYLDEGSSRISVTNNLSYNNLGGFHLHYGQDNHVSNNIFANNLAHAARKTRVEAGRSITFSSNIVYRSSLGDALKGFDAPDTALGRNIYFAPSGRPLLFGSMDFAAWQASGRDAGSVIADPRFIAPADNDYGLRDDSPALGIGFVPFDASLAGVYGDLDWLDQAARVQYAPLAMPPDLQSYSHIP